MIRGIFNFLLYFFGPHRQFYIQLVRLIGYLPAHVGLFRIAFTHKSASIALADGRRVNNERLEYLGDAILGAIVAEYIYMHFHDSSEGFMTKLRARVVKRKHLNATAIKMGIPMMIATHPHPANTSKHLYGNALEALIGAIYLDRGYHRAMLFFKNRMLRKHIDLVKLAERDSDYKSRLIEWSQKHKNELTFSSKEKDSKANQPQFQSVVKLNKKIVGRGVGDSKKEAEQEAARESLKTISE